MRLVTAALTALLALGCGTAYSEAPPDPDAGATSSSGGSSTSSSSSSSSSSSGDAALPPAGEAPAGQIRCATTTTTCLVGPEQCCITMTGTAGVVRSANAPSALCMAKGGPNCGTLTQTGDDFMQKLPQTCARASDCGAGESCCALPMSVNGGTGGDRYAKTIAQIVCRPQSDCLTTGRILCRTKADCPATTNCQTETDPILSKLYAAFCL